MGCISDPTGRVIIGKSPCTFKITALTWNMNKIRGYDRKLGIVIKFRFEDYDQGGSYGQVGNCDQAWPWGPMTIIDFWTAAIEL